MNTQDFENLFKKLEERIVQCGELEDELNAAAKEIELHGNQRNKNADTHQR